MKEKCKIINIHNNIARKHGKVTVKDLLKYGKLRYKKNKLKLDIDFLNNCKKPGVYPKLLIFRLPNVSNKDGSLIRKRLLPSAINKCNKELQNVSKELSLSEIKKSLQKLLNTQQKKLSSLTRSCSLPTFTANKDITNLTKYELSQEESDLHKAGLYTFQSNQIKFENQKSSLPLKRFIVCLLTTLNPRKLKVR